MSETARSALRQAVLAALQYQDGLNIASPGVWDVQPDNMPAVRVRASSDSKKGLGKVPPTFDTTVNIDVQLYVRLQEQEDVQATAEEISDRLENAILSNTGVIALTQTFANVDSQVYITTEGEAPIAKVDMTLALVTREQFVDDGPFMILKELDLYLDAKGGPVDAQGVYVNGTPFPDAEAMTPPLRSPVDGGPDGRMEGFIRIDMTTGLPPPPGEGDIPARMVVNGPVATFPDGTTLDNKRGWSFGRWGVVMDSDFDLAVQQGVTMIRIPLRWWGQYDSGADSRDMAQPATAYIDAGHLATVDHQIQMCVQRKIWYILFIDSNCGQNGTQSEGDRIYCQFGDPDSMWPAGRNFLTDPPQFALFRQVWRFAATKWGRTPYCAMFELLPEPSFPVFTPEQIQQLYRTLAADIRPLAPGIPFLVGPQQYKLTNIKDAWDPSQIDFIYTGDAFAHESTSDPVGDTQRRLVFALQLRQKQQVPIFIQQVGVNSSSGGDNANHDWLRGVLNILTTGDALGPIGATYWELRDPTSNADPGGYGMIWTLRSTGVDQIKTLYAQIIVSWIQGQMV